MRERPENPFAAYLLSHPQADAAALKELFRILAKRTHPDTGRMHEQAFVQLQEHYHKTLASLSSREETAHAVNQESVSPRMTFLRNLYRYKALLPSDSIDTGVPQRAKEAFAVAYLAAQGYREEAGGALAAFDRDFHARRSEIARYPDVRTKYLCFFHALAGFFDYEWMPNEFNLRVTRSYLGDLPAVDNYDPTKPPELRTNRSASARAALYRMRRLIEHELTLPVAELS